MSNRYKVFTGRSSKDTEERLAELGVRKRGGVPNPYQDKPQPTGRSDEGEATEFSRFDHSHPTVILPETDEQVPYPNEIRFNSQQKLVRWDDGSNTWVPLSVEVASNTAPPPTAEASVAGTSLEYSRADHTHQFRFPVVAPSNKVDGASYFDTTEGIKIYVGGTPRTRVVAYAQTGDVQPTGTATVGSAQRYALADHSHPTALLPQSNSQTPVVDEIRYTTGGGLVRWDGTNWVPIGGGGSPSDNAPNPAGGNPSAGTSDQYSRADHTHSVVLERTGNLSSPVGRQLAVFWSVDNIDDLVLAIRNGSQSRWDVVFSRPLVSQTTSLPSGRDFYTGWFSELAIRTQTGKQGLLYFRRYGETNWQPVGTILQTSGQAIGIVGELLRTSADITSTGQWFLRGVDNSGNVRALPLAIRTYNQSDKPTTNLPTNATDAYGFFIQDRRLIELYPQQTDGVSRPVMLTGYHYNIPVLPSELIIGVGNNNIQITSVSGFPALRFYGSTANSNLPYTKTVMHFLPMGVRKIRIGVLLRSGHPSGQFTYRFLFRIEGIETNSSAVAMATENSASFTMNPYSVGLYLSSELTITLPNTYGDIWGTPFAFVFQRRWDLETSNTNDLYVLGYVLIPVRE